MMAVNVVTCVVTIVRGVEAEAEAAGGEVGPVIIVPGHQGRG